MGRSQEDSRVKLEGVIACVAVSSIVVIYLYQVSLLT